MLGRHWVNVGQPSLTNVVLTNDQPADRGYRHYGIRSWNMCTVATSGMIRLNDDLLILSAQKGITLENHSI